LQVTSRSSREDHNRLQREYFEAADKRTMVPASSPYVWRQVRRMLEYAGVERGHSVLEVGAGLGRYSVPLLEEGHRLTCLDLSPAMLKKLREKAAPRDLPVIACDAADVDRHTRERFDRVVGFFFLHHVHDLGPVFQGLSRVMEPGGVAAFCEPVAHNPLYYVQIAVTPHIHWWAERGILGMRESVVFAAMRSAGLEETASATFGFFPPLLTNTGLGAHLEDALMRLGFLRPLHAFRIFRARRND
jgi:cyclopropane fatty-acyl-phospholipid synthase-like methyltransferase